MSSIENDFINSFNNFGLYQCISNSTHIKGRTLDLLLTNCPTTVDATVDRNTSICNSDHFPIRFNVKVNMRHKRPPKRKIFNFKRANWDALNRDLGGVNWDALVGSTEPEIAWRIIKSKIFIFAKKHIPTMTVDNSFQPPWFDSEVHHAYLKKERAHANRNKSDLNALKFSKARKIFKTIAAEKMRDNLYNSDDPELITKKFWSHVKSHSKSQRIPDTIHYNGRFRNDSCDKANLFNTFFQEQFSESSNYNINIDWSNDASFEIDFCHWKIRKILSQLNANKAQGPDGIHGKVLKNCAASLAYPLSIIFKISYNAGYIPKEWKVANVVPIHKKGSKEDVENYRPISLTCLVMKVFERIIKEELLLHIEHKLDQRQHGFLRNKSCTTNMIDFAENLAVSINDCHSMGTDIVYFDFSKAFDSVNHDLILHKLKYLYGVDARLLKFIKNYLCGREQCVVLGNDSSSFISVSSGVPQGSILGPILFVMFINDLPLGLDPETNVALYADDTKIWRPIRGQNDHDRLQLDIAYLNQWALDNKMHFHPKKCKVLSVCYKPSPFLGIFPGIKYNYYLGDGMLQYTECEKDLGVDMNSNFTFNDHCTRILNKANQQMGITRRTCSFVKDVKRRRTLYIALVRSQFEHCSPVWRPTNQSSMSKIESFQKSCIKWILCEEHLSYQSYDTYFSKCKKLQILTMARKFDLNDLILFHKSYHNIIPIKFPQYLKLFNGQTRLRSSHLDSLSFECSIDVTNTRSNRFKKSFFYRTHLLWNDLPFDIREVESPSIFKTRVTNHFWDSYVPSDPNSFNLLVDFESCEWDSDNG